MTLKFFSGLTVLAGAIFLEFFLAGNGVILNLAFATLIAFAFVFEFWELLVFDLIAVFTLNWQPAANAGLITFALIPLFAFGFRKITRWHGWIGNVIAIAFGFLIFYIVNAPALLLGNLGPFFMDLAVGLIVGQMELLLMS